jgi:hypothetical protein
MTEHEGEAQTQAKLPYFSLEDPEFCEAYDAWIKTQEANDEPGEGTAEWEEKLHEMALTYPDSVIEEPVCAEQDEAPLSESGYSTDPVERSTDSTASTTESPWPDGSMLPIDAEETFKELLYKISVKKDMHMQYARQKEPVVIRTDKGDILIYLAKKGKPNVIMLPAQCGIDLTLELYKEGQRPGRRIHVPPFHKGWKIISPGVKTSANLESTTDYDTWVDSNGNGIGCGTPQQWYGIA